MASAQGAQTRTILVVDDSSSLRKSLMSVLRKEGYAVEEAVDGSDGYEKIMAKQYALVLTDQNMPNLDGISMCERVKKEKPNHGTPIFMLTTETNVALKAAGKAAGILAWIVKPFDEKNLLKAIEKILSRPAA